METHPRALACCICSEDVGANYIMVLRMRRGAAYGQSNVCCEDCWDKAREEAWRNR